MFDSNTCNHLTVYKQRQYVYAKKIISNSFENEITYKSYLNVCKQMTDVELNRYCYIAILETI